jgi:hypothetical protein
MCKAVNTFVCIADGWQSKEVVTCLINQLLFQTIIHSRGSGSFERGQWNGSEVKVENLRVTGAKTNT